MIEKKEAGMAKNRRLQGATTSDMDMIGLSTTF